MYAADTLMKLIFTIFQVLVVASTQKITDMSNYLYSHSNLSNLTYEYLEDTGSE